jgi:hypothetical protein
MQERKNQSYAINKQNKGKVKLLGKEKEIRKQEWRKRKKHRRGRQAKRKNDL